MSITSDIRGYADTAVSQGRQLIDESLASAQAQINDLAGTANGLADTANGYVGKYRENVSGMADKANDAVNDLRSGAEKAVNLDALKSAIEPYLLQVREYGNAVTDRAEGLLSGVAGDPRFAKLVETANALSGVVIEQVNEYVVKPVQSFTGIGVKPAAKPAPTARKAPKPATTKPANRRPAAGSATKSAPAKASVAAKSTASKSTASTSTASKSTASKSTAGKATAAKPTARKAPAKRTPKA